MDERELTRAKLKGDVKGGLQQSNCLHIESSKSIAPIHSIDSPYTLKEREHVDSCVGRAHADRSVRSRRDGIAIGCLSNGPT